MNRFKSFFQLSMFALLTFGIVSGLQAQEEDKSKRESPPMTETATIGEVELTVDYSAPSVKDRTVWGELVPYGEVWRAGANEATTVSVSKDILVQGQNLPAGKYSLFTIPGEETWTVIFNSVADQWGPYDYDETKDVLRVETQAAPSEEMNEMLAYKVIEKDGQSHLVLMWENLMVPMTIAPAVSN